MKSMLPRVLVVEDDDELREGVLVPGLRFCGFDVHGVANAFEMYRELISQRYRLIVLDVGLPDEDGFLAARRLRETTGAGIVMLTGRGANADRVRGLDEGADLYLTKPIAVDVLAANLRSLLRRLSDASFARETAPAPAQVPVAARSMLSAMPAAATSSEAGDGWRLEADGWRLVAPNGKVVALSELERVVATRLQASPRMPVAREALVTALIEVEHDFDPCRLEMLVHRLRRKVASRCDEALPLTVVRKVGYMLRLDTTTALAG